jgi:hypothetical protein
LWALSQPLAATSPHVIAPVETSSLIIIQDNSLVGQTSPDNPPESDKNAIFNAQYPEWVIILMEKICECESGDDYTAENPTSEAYGRCQFLPSTQANVETKWGLTIDWKNPDQQLYACHRLLYEEGTSHWLESKTCWSKVLVDLINK